MQSIMDHDPESAEKAALLPRAPRNAHNLPVKRNINRQHRFLGAFIAFVIFIWWSYSAIPSLLRLGRQEHDGDARQLDFEDITPSEKLEWHPCYEQFKCARLTVAMDYRRPLNASSDNPKVHVALVLVPGSHSGPQKFSKSPLLINPGGPGGSGATIALALGRSIQTVVGHDQDVIGFDPRGVGATSPRADCFSYPADGKDGEDDYVRGQFHRTLWANAGREIGVVNSSSVALQKLDNRARAQAKLCADKDSLKGPGSIFRHLSTPAVARDMLSIVDAWDEWTATLGEESREYLENTLVNSLDSPTTGDSLKSDTSKDSLTLDTKGKLVYWGFSYGTFLGATFASMFPDRVGRLILDGVVDADNYASPVWSGSLRDTDAVAGSFSSYCHEAAESCALYRNNDTVADVEERFWHIQASIKQHPITLVDPLSKMPLVISYSDIRAVLFAALYAPTRMFPAIAIVLDSLYRESDSILGPLFGWPPALELQPFCGPPPPPNLYPEEAQRAIMCSDKRYNLNETGPNLNKLFEKLATESSWADIWMSLAVSCDGWQVSAVDSPTRWDAHPENKPITTSFPILFISNTADPVTPLYAGVKMAQKFHNAGLIEQKSEGHCSLAAVSQCTMKKVRAYIEKGEVPPPPVSGGKGRELIDGKWDTCEADEWPFHPFESNKWLYAKGEEGVGDVESMDALQNMQTEFYKQVAFWGQNRELNLGTLGDLSFKG